MIVVDSEVNIVLDSKSENEDIIIKENLKKIETIGKVCTKLENTIKDDSYIQFCKDRLKEGHTSIFEHCYAYFDVSDLKWWEVRDLLLLDSHIKVSHDGYIIGINYRSFINILQDSRNLRSKLNFIDNIEDISSIFYTLLYLTPELDEILFDSIASTNKINNVETYLYVIKRVNFNYVLEHCPEILGITFKITCDRGVTHELVRHRDFSFTQESTRYCNYSKDRFGNNISVIMPDDLENGNGESWDDAIATMEAEYITLINDGISPQIARSILPNATKADIYMTGTLDQWIGEDSNLTIGEMIIKEHKGFLPLRTDSHAHPQMREIANYIKDLLYTYFGKEIVKINNYGKY